MVEVVEVEDISVSGVWQREERILDINKQSQHGQRLLSSYLARCDMEAGSGNRMIP